MTNKLILSMDGLVLKEISLSKERMTIGRRKNNDIQIDNLAISGEHAVVKTIINDSFLEDLNSTNGTLVNGQPIKKHFLKDGDAIELGKYKLKFIVEQVLPADVELEKARALRAAALKSIQEKAAASESGENIFNSELEEIPQEPLPIGAVQILNGVNTGRQLDLSKTLTTFGKPGTQMAVIARRPQGYFITHVEGANFPSVNGKTLDDKAYPLSDGDEIDIAGVGMKFLLKKID